MPGIGELSGLPGLHEESARVAKYLRLDDGYAGDRRRDELHRADRGAVADRPVTAAALAHDPHEIFAVSALGQRLGKLEQLLGIDEPETPGDLLHAGHLQSLPLLDDAHEYPGIEQRIMGTGIEPRRSSSQPLDMQVTLPEIHPIEIRDLQFPARGRL